MPTDVLMPPLSQTMDTMVLVEWLKKVGDSVRKGEPLFLVESDKATLEVESPAAGIVAALLVAAGDEVPVKSRIAVIAAPGEVGEEGNATAQGPQGRKEETMQVFAPAAKQHGADSGKSAGDRIPLPDARAARVFASPRARRTAAARQIALESVTPSGPQGLIVERDVLAAHEQRQNRPRVSPVAARVAQDLAVEIAEVSAAQSGRITRADIEAAATSPQEGVLLDPTRRTIARRLSAAHQSIVPVTMTRACDATDLVAVRQRIVAGLADGQPRPTYTDFLAATVARTLRAHPALNGTFDGERIYLSQQVHLGLAVDTERGLLTPVLRDCERMGLLEIAGARERLAAAARGASISAEEMAGGTFTITNLGPLRVDAFTPLVNPPQIAILGMGRIRQAPAVFEGQFAVREVVVLSLTFDHRVVDGAPAARFLDDVAALIERPERVWLLPA